MEFIQADAIARYRRSRGDDTRFVTGADENAQKNVQAAEALGISVQGLVDRNTQRFIAVLEKLGVSNDDFIRTADKKRHWPGAKKLWELCNKRGDIYKKSYTGLYCVGCEAFLQEKDLVDGLCPEHQKAPEKVAEENYFFKLSKYQKQLRKLIENDTFLVLPETRKNEVLRFIESGLEDFSISRSAARMKGWGIPVPGDDTQIIYVWFDALINYMTALGFGTSDEKLFKRYWPCDLHVIGKGITRFHAIYWPAMLLSAGIELPKCVFVHGYVTLDGGKMSKSLGTVINPSEMVEKYGADALRYFLLGRIPTFGDGDFTEEQLIEAINNELVATLGNLVNRTFVFIERFAGGLVAEKPSLTDDDLILWKSIQEKEKKITSLLDESQLSDALKGIMEIARDGNGYFQKAEPWKTIKTDEPRAQASLYILAHLCRDLAVLLEPYLPATAESIFSQLNIEKQDWATLGILDLDGQKIGTPAHLFSKIEEKTVTNLRERFAGKQKTDTQPAAVKQHSETSSPEEQFSRLDLRVATIISAKKHPDAEKLFIEELDLGGLGKRQIVSGLAGHYTCEEMVGKNIVIVANLKKAKLRGVDSEGMLLAAEDDADLVGLVVADTAPGTRVTLEKTAAGEAAAQVDVKEFFAMTLEALGTKGVFFNGKKLLAGGKGLNVEKGVVGKVR